MEAANRKLILDHEACSVYLEEMTDACIRFEERSSAKEAAVRTASILLQKQLEKAEKPRDDPSGTERT